MFELLSGAIGFLNLVRNCLFPEGCTAEELNNARGVTRLFQLMGVLGVVFGIGSYLWALPDALDPLEPPAEAIVVADLTGDSFTGALEEALVKARIQLSAARFARRLPPTQDGDPILARLNPPYAFFPLTDAAWQPGDPVRVLLTIRQMWPNQREHNAQVFAQVGIPLDHGNAPQVDVIVRPDAAPIDMAYFQNALAVEGIVLAEETRIVVASAPDREDRIASYRAGLNSAGPVFFWMGLVFFGFATLLRLRLVRYLRTL